MDIINQLLVQGQNLWRTSSLTGRISAVFSLLIFLVVIFGVAIWSSMPDYKLLREGISPALTAEIVSVLDTAGIPNRMNYAGTGVSVPTSRWNEANVAIADLSIAKSGDPGSGGGGLMQTPPGHSEKTRAKEMALERSISRLVSVQNASVHLGISPPSPFRNRRSPSTASVFVEPVPGQAISRETASSIIQMVASAVEGLEPENVTFTDSGGRLFPNIANNDPIVNRQEFIRDLETKLAMKAQDVLIPFLGPDKGIVRVSATVDSFTDVVTEEEKIDAAQKVRLTESISSTDQKGAASAGSGIAGAASNGAGGGGVSQSGGGSSEKIETTDTTYDYPRQTITTTKVGGQILRLSISASVDVTPDTVDPNADPAAAPPQILTQEQVENLVKTAVGFDAARGDQIQVVLSEFSDFQIEEAASGPDEAQWEFATELARNASLGLAAIAALLIGMMISRKLQPIHVTDPSNERRQSLISELSSQVENNPEAASKILAAWLGEGDEPGETKKAA